MSDKQQPDEHKIKIFETDIGINAKVERHEVQGDKADRAQNSLRAIGHKLNPMSADSLEYMGTFAIHIYQSPHLKHLMYVKQSVRGDDEIPEVVASKAFEDLRHHIMTSYGRKAGTKRSGF